MRGLEPKLSAGEGVRPEGASYESRPRGSRLPLEASDLTGGALREAELVEFLDGAVEGIHRAGPDGTIVWANRAELSLLGYTAGEYIGRHVSESHLDQEVIEDILARVARGETVRNRRARLRAKDGSVRHVVIHCNGRWEDGEFKYSRCFTRDVTLDVGAEEVQARLAAIVTSSDDAIISKDLSGTITSWNRGAERMYGYTEAEAVGKPVTMLIPSDRLGEETHILSRVRSGGRIEPYETKRMRKDGTLIDVSLTVSPLMNAEGKVVGASKIARDITDRKRVEAERDVLLERERAARHELELAYQDIKDFAFIVSHDLREPLRGIANYAAFMTEDHAEALGAEGNEKLSVIRRLVRRSYDLLDAVMTVARVGRDALNLESVPVSQILGEAIEHLRLRIELEGALVTFDPCGTAVRCDRKLVVQALVNLVVNALKYNDSQPKRVRLSCRMEGGGAVLCVQDNGIGIDPRHHGRVFHMFKRLHASGKYGDGTGAGLAIVQKIVNRHGGRVWLTSLPGRGTTVCFTLGPGASATRARAE